MIVLVFLVWFTHTTNMSLNEIVLCGKKFEKLLT